MIFPSSFQPQKILIIKLRKLGDVLGTTPSVRQIHKLYPAAEITFLSEPLGAQVYEYSPYIKAVWVLNRNPTVMEYLKMIAKVRGAKFDIIIDLYHHNKTALMAMFSGAKYRLGFTHENEKVWSYNYTVSLSQQEKVVHNRTHHQLKLTELIGTNYEDDQLEFVINDEIRKFGVEFSKEFNLGLETIAFCVQSERLEAQVPPELLVKIANYLIASGKKLWFIYGPGEKEKAVEVYQAIENNTECVIDYPMPSVAEARAVLAHCAMYIGNDGGNKHLAVAAKTPTIGLFFGDNPKVWTPNEPSMHRYVQTKENANAFYDFKTLFEGWDENQKQFVL